MPAPGLILIAIMPATVVVILFLGGRINPKTAYTEVSVILAVEASTIFLLA
jgi:hypothetical protein